MLAVLTFIVFAALVAGLVTKTFALDDEVVAWVGAGLVGIGCAVLGAWSVVLHLDAPLDWASRVGGDLLLAGVGVGFVVAGLPTFAAGVL